MGKPTGFLEFTRELPAKRDVRERVGDYKEFIERFSDQKAESAGCTLHELWRSVLPQWLSFGKCNS
jgi:hypothetical protein